MAKRTKVLAASSEQIKQTMLDSGVRSLKTFGYPAVDTTNILTDYVYSKIFEQNILEMIAQIESDPQMDQRPVAIGQAMIEEIKKNRGNKDGKA